MQDLISLIKFIESYYQAIVKGFENAISLLPVTVEQHIQTQARQKLHTTLQSYLDALSVRMENYLLIMEIDDDNWIASAVETGVKGWSMKQTHLKSSKAKVSKQGYRYLRIPIGKEVKGHGGNTPKGQELQRKINEVMKRPSIGPTKLYTMMGKSFVPGVIPGRGPIVETQKVITADPDLKGLYRTRMFADAAIYHEKQASKRGMPKWQLVMMRTMSEKPGTSPWQHPGIEGVQILKDAKILWSNIIDEFFMNHIKIELDKIVFPK